MSFGILAVAVVAAACGYPALDPLAGDARPRDGSVGDGPVDASVDSAPPVDVAAISCNALSTCARLESGAVRCWGELYGGAAPADITGVSGGMSMSSGGNHSCAIVDGAAKCWGDNVAGDLGNDSTTASFKAAVQVVGLTSGVEAVGNGNFWGCAIVSGRISCWGQNNHAQLGDGTSQDSHVPVQVMNIPGGATAVSGGVFYTCAVVSGAAKCWGFGPNGELGNNLNPVSSPTPSQVTGLTSGVESISAGSFHACVIVNGSARCWGSGSFGRLGNGTPAGSPVPVQVSGLTADVQTIAAGGEFTCAQVGATSVRCWGNNAKGQLGNAVPGESADPVAVDLAGNVTGLCTGAEHACAIVDHHVKCWGSNALGQLGNPAGGGRTPVDVVGL